jgi:hypothetical protein
VSGLRAVRGRKLAACWLAFLTFLLVGGADVHCAGPGWWRVVEMVVSGEWPNGEGSGGSDAIYLYVCNNLLGASRLALYSCMRDMNGNNNLRQLRTGAWPLPWDTLGALPTTTPSLAPWSNTKYTVMHTHTHTHTHTKRHDALGPASRFCRPGTVRVCVCVRVRQ